VQFRLLKVVDWEIWLCACLVVPDALFSARESSLPFIVYYCGRYYMYPLNYPIGLPVVKQVTQFNTFIPFCEPLLVSIRVG